MPTTTPILELDQFPSEIKATAKSFVRRLRADDKATHTVRTYTAALRGFVAFLLANHLPLDVTAIRPNHIQMFIDHLTATGSKPSSVVARYKGLAAFFSWCESENEIATNPMRGVTCPRPSETEREVTSLSLIQRLEGACKGKGFLRVRDKALIRFLACTGARRQEAAMVTVGDVDLQSKAVIIGRGGSVPRFCPLDQKTVRALNAYLQARRRHRDGDRDELWLGIHGPMTHSGIAAVITKSARRAGLDGVCASSIRRAFTQHWVSNGLRGSDLRRLAGWRSKSSASSWPKATTTDHVQA
jgi:site-specific recombinase XerD